MPSALLTFQTWMDLSPERPELVVHWKSLLLVKYWCWTL